jgi:hypothetical protein
VIKKAMHNIKIQEKTTHQCIELITKTCLEYQKSSKNKNKDTKKLNKLIKK